MPCHKTNGHFLNELRAQYASHQPWADPATTARIDRASINHPSDEDLSPGTPINHPSDEDLSPGTPINPPSDEDLSPGTPINHRRRRLHPPPSGIR